MKGFNLIACVLIFVLLPMNICFLPRNSCWLKPSSHLIQQRTPSVHGWTILGKIPPISRLKFTPDDVGADEFYAPVEEDALEWDKVYAALQAYLKTYGNVNVHHRFVIQSEDFAWPEKTRGLPLGLHVLAVQCGRYVEGHPERRALLDELQFPWEVAEDAYPELVELIQPDYFNETLTALRLYKEHVDPTVRVNKTYLVPAQDPPWPSNLFFYPLGNICYKLREHKEVLQILSPSKVKLLDELGFLWSSRREMMSEENFNQIFTALIEYKKKYGHMRVPYLFEVPTNSSEWSEGIWGLKLGQRVKSLRVLVSILLHYFAALVLHNLFFD